MFVFSYFFWLNVHYDGGPFVECKCDVELLWVIWGESSEVLQALLSLGGHLCTKHSKQPKLHCYTSLHIIIFFIQNHKSSTPTGKKKRKSVLVSRVFQQSQNQVVIADGCCMRKCCLGVHWPGLGKQPCSNADTYREPVNSESKLFGSVTCMFFTLYMHINWYGDSVLWLEFQSW